MARMMGGAGEAPSDASAPRRRILAALMVSAVACYGGTTRTIAQTVVPGATFTDTDGYICTPTSFKQDENKKAESLTSNGAGSFTIENDNCRKGNSTPITRTFALINTFGGKVRRPIINGKLASGNNVIGLYIALAVAPDPYVVGVYSPTVTSNDHAFRYDIDADIFLDLGALNNQTVFNAQLWRNVALDESTARGVNYDGSVVVGDSTSTTLVPADLTDPFSQPYYATHAFRWTQANGMVDIGTLIGPTGYSSATGVSDDGTVIVGNSDSGTYHVDRFSGSISRVQDAFRFVLINGATGTGTFTDLGDFGAGRLVPTGDLMAGQAGSKATGISGDGNVVVGYAQGAISTVSQGLTTYAPYTHAFRWTAATGLVDLGTTPGQVASYAYAVSRDRWTRC